MAATTSLCPNKDSQPRSSKAKMSHAKRYLSSTGTKHHVAFWVKIFMAHFFHYLLHEGKCECLVSFERIFPHCALIWLVVRPDYSVKSFLPRLSWGDLHLPLIHVFLPIQYSSIHYALLQNSGYPSSGIFYEPIRPACVPFLFSLLSVPTLTATTRGL